MIKNVKYSHLLNIIIWRAELNDMKLISNYNKRIRFFLYLIDIYTKYAWVACLKDK